MAFRTASSISPEANELLVIDGEKPSQVFDAATLKVKRTYSLPKGADSVGFDSSTKHLWVVTGGKDVPQKDSNLIEIDPATGKTVKSVHFDADHVEAMAVEQKGPDLFINVTDKNYLAVVDKASGKVIKQIPIKEAEQNAPIAMDEANHRLFVVTRKPGKLLVLNSDTGQTIAAFTAPERTDEVVWDAGQPPRLRCWRSRIHQRRAAGWPRSISGGRQGAEPARGENRNHRPGRQAAVGCRVAWRDEGHGEGFEVRHFAAVSGVGAA